MKIPGVNLINLSRIQDSRGEFIQTWRDEDYSKLGFGGRNFCQDNQSISARGVFRGMHSQTGQSKLVRVVQGKILDIVFDNRPEWNLGTYMTFELDAEHPQNLFVPKGCLHGFLALEDKTIVAYRVDEYWNPQDELGVRYNDPALGIDWSSGILQKYNLSEKDLIISEKDKNHKIIKK